MILPIGTSGYNIRYTSEYIPKLQIHQHSLLTKKVCLDTIHQHKSSSLDNSSKLGHHQSWIVIGSSSLLDHHQSWIIIIIIAPAIPRKWCYLSILLVIGSSIEPSLFHVGCRPSLQVGLHLLQYLYLTMRGTHQITMSEWLSQHLHLSFLKNGSQLQAEFQSQTKTNSW